ncbi:YycH family regulatory protein [Oceanobacillus bengalensis]
MERAKSFILVLLIGISFILTFGLWNYQPNIADISDGDVIDEADLGGIEETTRTLIQPSKIIFHTGQKYYGFIDPKEQKNLYEEMIGFRLYDFRMEQYDANETASHDVEVIFPTELPMEILNSLFHFNNAEVQLPTWSFQRIYFTFNNHTSSINLEIVSIDGSKKATAVINDSSHYEFLKSYMDDGSNLQEYVLITESGSTIYIPKDPANIKRLRTTYRFIDEETAKNVLFNDPSIVNQSNSSIRGITYFTDSSQLRILQDGSRMLFVSPDSEDTRLLSFVELLNRSIVNINGHDGWTNDYNLMEFNMAENMIRYQMYYQDYPVFSSSNLSIIEQRFNSQRLVEYNRPLIRLDSNFPGDEVDLESSEVIIRFLSEQGYLENITDIRIGFRLSYQTQADDEYILVFEPGWFMKYNDSWTEINLNDGNSSHKGGD